MIDVETTGLSPQNDRVVDLAVVTTDPRGQVLEEWATRINPERPVEATHVHGITQADVLGAPVFSDVIAPLTSRLAGAAVVAHHARFDLAFLRAEYTRAGWDLPFVPTLCTLQASDYHLPSLERRRLADCCRLLGIPVANAHSALGDARATAGLLAAFVHPRFGLPPLEEHLRLPDEGLTVRWPSGPSRKPTATTRAAPTGELSLQARKRIAAAASVSPAPALVQLIERFSLLDALDDGAPEGSLTYLEKLAEVLEDGEISVDEAADLSSVAETERLGPTQVAAANLAFVRTLAHAALSDGKVSRAERAELQQISDLLEVETQVISTLLKHAEDARQARLSASLGPLPSNWTLGEPLRVGDKVTFTGCDEALRLRLEQRSEQLGVRIMSSVSRKTSMLVTDGTMNGGKAARARELSTRTVDPITYGTLLAHLQPAVSHATPAPRVTSTATVPLPATDREDIADTEAPRSVAVGDPLPAAVRAWARANGYDIGARGRIHVDIVEAYRSAHPLGDQR